MRITRPVKNILVVGLGILFLLSCDFSTVTQSSLPTEVARALSATQTIEAAVQQRVQATMAAQAAAAPTSVPPTITPNATVTSAVVPPTALPTIAATPIPTRVPPTATTSAPAQTRRLNTGAIVKRAATWSAGAESYLRVTNSQPLDAVVVLARFNAPGLAVYIRANDSYKIENIETGSYVFYYVFGEDWDSSNAKFTRKAEYHRFTGDMKFERILNPTTATYTYTYWEVPLIPGNAQSDVPVIDEAQFLSLK